MTDMVECPTCAGSGIDECHACGQNIDCEECEGTGEVEGDE